MQTDINPDRTVPSQGEKPQAAEAVRAAEAAEVREAAARPIARGLWIAAALVLLLVVLGIVFRMVGRATDEHHLERATETSSVLNVSVTSPTVDSSTSEISLPGNTQAFNDTPIYARTNGYLKQWFVDIGQRVTKGQLMATIETPELDEQLQVARADLKSAQADLNLANTTAGRYQNLLKSDSVSRQETDVAVSGAAAKQAAVDAQQANVRRLLELQSFERVYAPYSGIVTARNTDIGNLINSGSGSSSSTAQPLFRVASVRELRVFVAVPEVYAPSIHDGDRATLTLDEYPGQQFFGTVTRNSNAIDPSSRTLNVEVDVDNSSGKLLPGAYVFVHFRVPQGQRRLSIPSNTLLFRAQGLQVGLVQNGHVHLQHVTIARDNGTTVEIGSGLTADDRIVLNPSDSLYDGQPVHVANGPAGGQ